MIQSLRKRFWETRHQGLQGKTAVRVTTRQMLYVILAMGLIIRTFFAARGNLNLDEGQWLYDIQLLAQGAIPFVDWTTRAPLLLAVTACFTKILGNSLLIARLISAASATVTSFILYQIGKEGASEKVGLTAAALFSLSPFVIYQTIIIHEHPLQGVLVSLAMLFLLRGLRENRNSDAFLHGLFLALAYLVRRSSPIYFLTEPILWLLFRKKIVTVVEKLCHVAMGAIVGILPLVPLVIMTDLRWMWLQYGAGGLSVTPSTTGDYSPANVLFNAVFFLVPQCVLLVRHIVQRLLRWLPSPDKREIAVYASVLLSLICFLLLSLPDSWTDRYNVIPIARSEEYVMAILFGMGLLLVVPQPHSYGDNNSQHLVGISTLWLVTIVGFYLVVQRRWILDYSMELVPPICLMAGMALFANKRIENTVCCPFSRPRRLLTPVMPILLLIIHTAWSGYILAFRPTYARRWSQTHVATVGEYLASRTKVDEKIFTGDTIFGITANRPIVLNLSHPAIYYMTGNIDPVSYDPYDVIPSQIDLLRFLAQHDVRYIPADARTNALVDNYPPLRAFVDARYREEAIIGSTHIYRRLPEHEINLPSWEAVEIEEGIESVYLNYGYQMELLGYSVEEDIIPGERATATLYWRFLTRMPSSYETECQLLDPNYVVWERTFQPLQAYGKALEKVYTQSIPLHVKDGFPAPAFARLKVAIRDAKSGKYLPLIGHQYEMVGYGTPFGQLRIVEEIEGLSQDQLPLATFGQVAVLVDSSLPHAWVPGTQNVIGLTWKALSHTKENYAVFVHMVDEDGNLIAQDDSQPRDGFFPTSLWKPGDIVPDSYSLELPNDIAPDKSYHLFVGYYLVADMERLPAWDANGDPLPNHQFTLAQDIVISGDVSSTSMKHREIMSTREPSHDH